MENIEIEGIISLAWNTCARKQFGQKPIQESKLVITYIKLTVKNKLC